MIKTLLLKDEINYDATQMHPHWIYRNHGVLGDAIVAFSGEVHVALDKMVDLTDVREKEFIYSPRMLNFIVEHFNTDLEMAIYRQLILIVAIKEELEGYEVRVQRIGDDLYVERAKLSVSIATSTVVSTLIHIGLNIETKGTPVKTAGLKELGITDISAFAQNVMLRYKRELERIYEARCKARGIIVDS
ncbi:MAG: DUF366 family protein [Syntrophomonas sp.]|jgi:hypothetical protein|nr:DUF366 family protein [Syntrophomonas sp.]